MTKTKQITKNPAPEIWKSREWQNFMDWKDLLLSAILALILICGIILGAYYLFGWKSEEIKEPRLPVAEDRIDMKLVQAIGRLETQNCRLVVGRNNCYNIKDKYGGYVDFASENEATAYLIHLLTTSHYYQDWRASERLEDLARVYAEDPLYVWKLKSVLTNL